MLFGVSVGALSSLSVFEPMRPYLIGLGGALLLYAGGRIRRRARAGAGPECADEACSPISPARRLNRGLFWIASGIYIVAASYPAVLGALYG